MNSPSVQDLECFLGLLHDAPGILRFSDAKTAKNWQCCFLSEDFVSVYMIPHCPPFLRPGWGIFGFLRLSGFLAFSSTLHKERCAPAWAVRAPAL